jgi:hypothetical protein
LAANRSGSIPASGFESTRVTSLCREWTKLAAQQVDCDPPAIRAGWSDLQIRHCPFGMDVGMVRLTGSDEQRSRRWREALRRDETKDRGSDDDLRQD